MTDVAFIPDFLEFDKLLIRIGNRYFYNYISRTKQQLIDKANKHPDYKVRNKALQDLDLIEESQYTDFIDVHAEKNYTLSFAARYGCLDAVKFLVEQGADIHADNNLALRCASPHGHLDVVKYLVEQGADISSCNYESIRWAKENNRTEVVKYLENVINEKII